MQQKRTRVSIFIAMVLVFCLGGSGCSSLMQPGDSADSGVIRGTVRDQQNPLYGILVKAKAEGKISSTSVITDEQGEYVFPPLPAGNYAVSVGSQWQETVSLDSSPVQQDFVVELGPGFMNQTSGVSWFSALPGTDEERKLLSDHCSGCHSIWRLVDRAQDSPEKWLGVIRAMSAIGGAYRVILEKEHFPALAKYLSKAVSPDLKNSDLVAAAMIRPRGEAAKAVFTEWELPEDFEYVSGIKADSKGIYWFTISGLDGALGRLDPRTGEYQTWPAPLGDTLTEGRGPIIHDLALDEEENVWITGRRIMKFNTQTSEFTYWNVPAEYGWNAHTGAFDPDGNYWFTMRQGEGYVIKLDPRTDEMTAYRTPTETPGAYGLVGDGKGIMWFTEIDVSKLANIDTRTGKITEYPTLVPNSGPRRLQMDSKGNLWFTQSFTDMIGKFDPVAMKLTDYEIGVPGVVLTSKKPGGAYPYGLRIDREDQLWFDLRNGNTIGKMDSETGKVTFILFPVPDSGTRDPGIDVTEQPAFLYGGHIRPAIGRVYMR